MESYEMERLQSNLMYVAWIQALIATLGSLFFSEIMNFIPCELCWYQRIAMYPLVLILTTGILLNDQKVNYYILPLSLVGLFISIYHNLLYYGIISEGFHTCTVGVPCETRWIQWIGFIGIPLLSLTAFTVIILSIMWYKPIGEKNIQENNLKVRTRLRTALTIGLLILYTGMGAIAAANGQSTTSTDDTQFDPLNMTNTQAESNVEALASTQGEYPSDLIIQGEQLYNSSCATCHGLNGQGIPNVGVKLVNNSFIAERDDSTLIEFISTGRTATSTQTTTGVTMPGKGGNLALSNEDIFTIIAYVRSILVGP